MESIEQHELIRKIEADSKKESKMSAVRAKDWVM